MGGWVWSRGQLCSPLADGQAVCLGGSLWGRGRPLVGGSRLLGGVVCAGAGGDLSGVGRGTVR